MTTVIVDIFQKNRKAYGTRKIKAKLHERGLVVSKRRIGRIMNELGLVSTYTVAQYKPHKTACNEAATSNTLNRDHSAGPHKDAALVSRAFATVKGDLRRIQWFHTDRSSEFKNQKMDELLETFEIGRSLSAKGCPYDNAVAEATYKIMKTEFVNQMNFQSLCHLELELYDYVHWFNQHRIHGTLGYMTPV